jgi:hypothetical protein
LRSLAVFGRVTQSFECCVAGHPRFMDGRGEKRPAMANRLFRMSNNLVLESGSWRPRPPTENGLPELSDRLGDEILKSLARPTVFGSFQYIPGRFPSCLGQLRSITDRCNSGTSLATAVAQVKSEPVDSCEIGHCWSTQFRVAHRANPIQIARGASFHTKYEETNG